MKAAEIMKLTSESIVLMNSETNVPVLKIQKNIKKILHEISFLHSHIRGLSHVILREKVMLEEDEEVLYCFDELDKEAANLKLCGFYIYDMVGKRGLDVSSKPFRGKVYEDADATV